MSPPLVELSALMVARGGSVDPRKHPNETFELLSIPAYDRGLPDVVAGESIGSTKQLVQAGDVMLSKIVPHIRRAWVVPPRNSHRQIASGEWIVFRNDQIYGPYFRQLLVSDAFNNQFMKTVAGVGGSLLRARPAHVAKIKVPLPPLDEQRRIAAILDKADELRAKRREALAYLDALTRSIFHNMFGVDDLSHRVMMVAELAAPGRGTIRTGPFGSQLLTREFTEDGIAVLGIDNAVQNKFAWKERRYISAEKYKTLERYTVNPGDVVVTIMGTLGRCAVIPDDIPPAINTKHLCCITLNQSKCLPEFLHSYFLMHPTAKRFLGQTTKGSIMGGLNMGIIKNLPVELPPLSAQQEFSTRVAAVDRLKDRQRTQLVQLDALFASLQHRAFKGEL